jgi:hypothetical protein
MVLTHYPDGLTGKPSKYNSMQAKDLVLLLLEHSGRLHPDYAKEQHLIWVVGMLADIACEENSKDNQVLATLRQRLDQLYASK